MFTIERIDRSSSPECAPGASVGSEYPPPISSGQDSHLTLVCYLRSLRDLRVESDIQRASRLSRSADADRAGISAPSAGIAVICVAQRHARPTRTRRTEQRSSWSASAATGCVGMRNRNAAVNHHRYRKECENRSGDAPTRVEIGVEGLAPVPVVDARMLTGAGP